MPKTITYKDFETDDAAEALKLLDFYEGNQMEWLIKELNGDGMGSGRKNWKARGIIPRVRNVTKMVVEKSGLLFNQPPELRIDVGNDLPVTDDKFNEIMNTSDWKEFFQNVDTYTRLLKTTVVLQQRYIPTAVSTVGGVYMYDKTRGDRLVLSLLHRGNAVFKMDVTGTVITELAYKIEDDDDEDDEEAFLHKPNDEWCYRYMNAEVIEDWMVQNDKEFLMKTQPNPDGFVPASPFYDTNRPRKGVWCDCPEDLISLQELVNLHLTDLEFAIAHQKQKTLFTNSSISTDPQNVIPHASQGFTPAGTNYGQAAGSGDDGAAALGGLGSVVFMDGNSQQQPFVEYKGPQSDLDTLSTVVEAYVKAVAFDWSVRIDMGGTGRANSGFQLVVEEMDNLNLRQKRSQSFEAGFRKFYDITQILYPELTSGSLIVKFAPPSLPVNKKEEEEMWAARIEQGRASVLDYFRSVQGMSDSEAWAKIEEIQQVNAKLGLSIPETAKEQATAPAMKSGTQLSATQ